MGIVTENTNVYSGPSATIYPKIGTLFAGDQYTKIWDELGYSYIEYPVTNGVKRGYIVGGANVTPNEYAGGVQGTAMYPIPVYSSPNSNRIETGSLSQGESISVLSRDRQLYYVEYGTSQGAKRGWVSPNNIRLNVETVVGQIISNTSTYADANTNQPIGSLSASEFVVVLAENSYFLKVEYCISTTPFRKQAYIPFDKCLKFNSRDIPEITTYDSIRGIQATTIIGAPVYAGPGASIYATIGGVNANEKVRALSYEKGYFEIGYYTSNGAKRGYIEEENILDFAVLRRNVNNNAQDLRGFSEKAIGNSLTTYTGPASSFAHAGSVENGEPVTRFNIQENGYTLIEYATPSGTKRGFIENESVTHTGNGTLGFASAVSDVYFQREPLSKIGSVYANEYVVILSESKGNDTSNTYFIEYNTANGRKRGFIAKDKVEVVGNLTIAQPHVRARAEMVAQKGRTVYGGPGTNDGTIGSSAEKELVLRFHTDSGYSYIEYTVVPSYDIKCGYVSSEDLAAAPFEIPDYRNNTDYEQYGTSGMGLPLIAYRLGSGNKKIILNFGIHGWEDVWSLSGRDIVRVGETVLNYFKENEDILDNNHWTMYIILSSNPDGLIYGDRNNGPGRCTMKHIEITTTLNGEQVETTVDGGIDLNRSFPTDAYGSFYPKLDSARQYTTSYPNASVESRALKAFLDRDEFRSESTIFIDTHGYTKQILSDSLDNEFTQVFGEKFGYDENRAKIFDFGYVSYYAHHVCGMRSCLFEFPSELVHDGQLFEEMCDEKYIAAIEALLTA